MDIDISTLKLMLSDIEFQLLRMEQGTDKQVCIDSIRQDLKWINKQIEKPS